MIIRDKADLAGLKAIGSIVARCLHAMKEHAAPGMTTKELDDFGHDFLKRHGAMSAPIAVYKFPGATCISLNQEAAHGIPSATRVIRDGDLINIDVSAVKGGYFGDTGESFVVGSSPDPELLELCRIVSHARDLGITAAQPNRPLNLIGKAIEEYADSQGMSVIENLCSHGVGLTLHDDPDHILGYFDPDDKRILPEKVVITVEPFLSTGCVWVEETADGWTLINTEDHLSVQCEHTIVVMAGKPLILTALE